MKAWSDARKRLLYVREELGSVFLRPPGPRQALSYCLPARPGWEGVGQGADEGSEKSQAGHTSAGGVRRPE